MPLLLKKESIRLLEASLESLSLAITGLGMPRRIEVRESSSIYATPIGLIGVSAELAMSAVVIQALGPNALLLRNGHFKSGSEILDDFKNILRNPVPRHVFLTKGVVEPLDHLSTLLELISNFKILISSRAGGLHAGKGPSKEVCIVAANDVIKFLNTLALSAPY